MSETTLAKNSLVLVARTISSRPTKEIDRQKKRTKTYCNERKRDCIHLYRKKASFLTVLIPFFMMMIYEFVHLNVLKLIDSTSFTNVLIIVLNDRNKMIYIYILWHNPLISISNRFPHSIIPIVTVTSVKRYHPLR